MVIFNPCPQRAGDSLPHLVGVFEDDAELLQLAARSRATELCAPRASGRINSHDLALDDARLGDSESWDL